MTEEEELEIIVTFFMMMMQATAMVSTFIHRRLLPRASIRNFENERQQIIRRFYTDSDVICHNQLRMNRRPFQRICCRLRSYGLADSRSVSVEEQVAMFLLTVGHNWRNRSNIAVFFRSGQTISHYFHEVLSKLLLMYRDVVVPCTANNSPAADCGKDRPWEAYFKDAVGAIDGSHFPVNVKAEDAHRYRDRKGNLSTNVLVSCTFDMRITYVLTGWEGSAHDGRVLRNAISRDGHRLTLPIDIQEMNKILKEMTGVGKAMADAMTTTNYEELYMVLNTLTGLTEDELITAYNIFSSDKEGAKAFLRCPNDRVKYGIVHLKLYGTLPPPPTDPPTYGSTTNDLD